MVKSAKKQNKKQKQPARAAKRASGATSRKPVRRAAKPARARGPTPKPVVIDVHAHILVPEIMKFTYERSLFAQGVAERGVGGRPEGVPEPLLARMTEPPLRIKDMDAAGVDIQVISPSILQQCTYWAEPDEALRMERLGNDRVAEAVVQHPDRLIGLGSLPLQDIAPRPPSSNAACAISTCAASSFHRTSMGSSSAMRCGHSGPRRRRSAP